jgi:hypothetical protein
VVCEGAIGLSGLLTTRMQRVVRNRFSPQKVFHFLSSDETTVQKKRADTFVSVLFDIAIEGPSEK